MPRKVDMQAEGVLRYFETAEIAEAALVLRLGRAALGKRIPKAAAKPAAATVTPAAAPRTRRARVQTTVSEGAAALPGMQETVG